MALFPAEMPAPEPNLDEMGFWQGCAERQLRFQACARCHSLRHPPTPICSKCHSVEQTWRNAPAHATIFSFTEIHHASHPAVASNLPYIVAVVEFETLPNVRLVTNILGIPASELAIGDVVELTWDRISDELFLPRFTRPAGRSQS
jgi:uncharacterized OB-fold protein